MISIENHERVDNSGLALQGRLALVAGAETVIGRELVSALSHAGADVIAGVTNGGSTAFPPDIDVVEFDASDLEASIARLESVTEAREIELFLSASAAVPEADALLVYPEDLERSLSAHLYLPFALAQHVAARLVATTRHGVIVLIGSETQRQPAARTLARGVACAAAAHMAHCLASEWRAYGIRTHMLAVRESHDPLNAPAASAEDVAANALYLLSEAGSTLAVGHDLVLEPLDARLARDSYARASAPSGRRTVLQ